jgi:poly-gamma-glutamate synthesis protein (capsule biosynthesis protein)
MASTFVPYGAASRARPDLPGRPGLNPLAVTDKERAIVVPSRVVERIRAFGRIAGRSPKKLQGRSFRVGVRFHVGTSFGVERGRQLIEADREANLAAIAETAGRADIVVASIHAHHQGRWLREFADDAIRHGADIVFVHGPHEVRAIELRGGRPIFYSMGDFAFEVESVAKLPAETYERGRLGDSATPSDVFALARRPGSRLFGDPMAFEGFAAKVSIIGSRVAGVRLLPVDLQFDAPDECRGRPQIAAPAMAKRIVERVAALSRPFGTRIRYDAGENCGSIEIP